MQFELVICVNSLRYEFTMSSLDLLDLDRLRDFLVNILTAWSMHSVDLKGQLFWSTAKFEINLTTVQWLIRHLHHFIGIFTVVIPTSMWLLVTMIFSFNCFIPAGYVREFRSFKRFSDYVGCITNLFFRFIFIHCRLVTLAIIKNLPVIPLYGRLFCNFSVPRHWFIYCIVF